jgi:branched-chain amino acid transport system substrate-binding protein
MPPLRMPYCHRILSVVYAWMPFDKHLLPAEASRAGKTREISSFRKRTIWLPLALGAALWLWSAIPGIGVSAKEPIRIAAIFSQTGIAASHNEPLIPMVQLAIEDINRRGGILGRPIWLILLDNQSSPIGSTIAAEEAVRMGVTAVIGAHWSSHSLAMAPILQKAGIPMISPGSTNPEVTKTGNYIFRACFLDSFQGKAMARFASRELHARSAVVVRNIDEAYSVMLAEFFKTSFIQSGGQVLLDTGYRGKAIDFSEIIEKIRTAGPDVVYLPGYTRDSGLFIKQARDSGLGTTFLGGDAWDEIETYAGSALEGSYQSAPWHPEVPFPKSEYLQTLYFQKYGKPIDNMSAPLAFDTVCLLADAIAHAGSLDKNLIREALAATDHFEGATGVITFDENGDPQSKEVVIIQFRNHRREFHSVIRPYGPDEPLYNRISRANGKHHEKRRR